MSIKYLDILNNFETNMRNNPELMPSSVNTYLKLIKELVERYSVDPSVDELNEFIAIKSRKRQPVVKYAIKHYLKFRWRDGFHGQKWKEIYDDLVKAKIRATIRKNTYIKREQAADIINAIDKQDHKLISKIQYFTGARASEVISIKKSDVKQEYQYKRIRIDIMGKGGRKESIYLRDDLWHEIQPFMLTDNRYLFLKDNREEWSDEVLRKKVETQYKRYYESLRSAAEECGIKFATHDWRRSFAQSIKQSGAGIEDVKSA